LKEQAAGVRSKALAYDGALDGIRAVSIALVIGLHSPWSGVFPFNRGWIGVDVFFVLSGYLITALLLRERDQRGTVSLKHFYLRRALRILPALFAWVAVLGITNTVGATVLLVIVFYVANLAMAFGYVGDGPAAHSWSLGIEEQFYAFWPWVVRRAAGRRLLIGTLAAVLAIAVWRAALIRAGVQAFPEIYLRPDTRMDAPLWGCAAALVERETGFQSAIRAFRPRAEAVLAGLLGLGAVSFYFSRIPGPVTYTFAFGLTFNAAITAAVILWLRAYPQTRPARALGTPILAWIGRLSYSLYLWHRVAFQAGEGVSHRLLGFSPREVPPGTSAGARAGSLGIWFAFLLLVPAASYYLIEKPFLRLKAKIGTPS
jgi:peptidoglycan/LPS O-acetylase OafA/YrhL